jgi:CTP:molybdopterin cytidylyltransferase MocA
MQLILAAAGQGSRMGPLGAHLPKALIREPTSHQPLLHHIYKRIEAESSLDHIIIVGASDSPSAGMIAESTKVFPFKLRPEVSVVLGDRRGVGFAFLLGLERAVSLGLENTLLSVADSVATTYGQLTRQNGSVVVGVTRSYAEGGKQHSTILVDSDGWLRPLSAPQSRCSARNVAGMYALRGDAITEYIDIFREELLRNSHQDAMNAKGEYRVSWVWESFQERGYSVRTADVGEIAEINFPEDLTRFRDFFRA